MNAVCSIVLAAAAIFTARPICDHGSGHGRAVTDRCLKTPMLNTNRCLKTPMLNTTGCRVNRSSGIGFVSSPRGSGARRPAAFIRPSFGPCGLFDTSVHLLASPWLSLARRSSTRQVDGA
jgi:hypothetical protein